MHTSVHQLPINRAMPSCSIIPVLAYEDVGMAIKWLCDVFGFTERWRAGNHRAQLAFGDSAVALTGQKTDKPLQGHSIMVRVADVDGHYKNALAHAATILQSPADFPYGERQYSTVDPGGHVWTFSQSIADTVAEDWGGTTAK